MDAPVSAAIPLAWHPRYASTPEIRRWLLTFRDPAVLQGLCLFNCGDREEICGRLAEEFPSIATQWVEDLREIRRVNGAPTLRGTVPQDADFKDLSRQLTVLLDATYPSAETEKP